MNRTPKGTPKLYSETSEKYVAPTNGMLHKLAFDCSLQASIVSLVSTGEIMIANRAACRLLGYSVKELTSPGAPDIFDPGFKKWLTQQTAAGQPKAFVTVIRKNGKLLPCEITSAVFMDENGRINAITTLTDMSKSILKQKHIDTQKKKIVTENIVQARSKQKGIDIKNKKIVAGNIVIAKSRQKGIDIKNRKIVADNIVLAKTRQKKIDARKDKLVANNIIRALEKSDTQEAANNILFKESLKLIFNSSSDVLYELDLLTHEIIISDAYEKEFGYKAIGTMTPIEDWIQHIHPDDKEAVRADYIRILASKDSEWKYNYRFIKADDSVANVLSNGIILRNTAGVPYCMIGSMQDISKQKVLEAKLVEEIMLKETMIAEAMEDAKETQRSDIGRELHDNVNQLLGASKLYLDMAKKGGPNTKMYLTRSSEYTLTAIEEIRKLTKSLTTDTIKDLGLREAIDHIIRDLMEVNPLRISLALDTFDENSMNDKFKLNLLRIVQEQLNNILKHAKATKATISLLQDKKSIILSISDNGIGFDTAKMYTGIGMANINSRALSCQGTAYFASRHGGGCVLTATFPITALTVK